MLPSWLRHWRAFLKKSRQRATTRLDCEPLENRLLPSISPTGSAFAALAGQTYSGVVASFTPASGTSSSDYQATILWGDGNSSAGSIDGSGT